MTGPWCINNNCVLSILYPISLTWYLFAREHGLKLSQILAFLNLQFLCHYYWNFIQYSYSSTVSLDKLYSNERKPFFIIFPSWTPKVMWRKSKSVKAPLNLESQMDRSTKINSGEWRLWKWKWCWFADKAKVKVLKITIFWQSIQSKLWGLKETSEIYQPRERFFIDGIKNWTLEH